MADLSKASKRLKVQRVLHDFQAGKLHTGGKHSAPVTDRAQAINIALAQAMGVTK